jgi:hypothetical protein
MLVQGKTAFVLFKDTLIVGNNLNSLIYINDPSLFQLTNISIREQSAETDPIAGFLIYLSSSQIINLDTISVIGIRQAIFFQENS